MIAHSLTHLVIFDGCSIPLQDVFESCPSLVSLSTFGEGHVFRSSSPSTRYPKMAHLAIHNVLGPRFTYDTMVDILKLFPSLMSLKITPTPDSSVLTILHEYCPSLQILNFSNEGAIPERNDVHPNRSGITYARLHG